MLAPRRREWKHSLEIESGVERRSKAGRESREERVGRARSFLTIRAACKTRSLLRRFRFHHRKTRADPDAGFLISSRCTATDNGTAFFRADFIATSVSGGNRAGGEREISFRRASNIRGSGFQKRGSVSAVK